METKIKSKILTNGRGPSDRPKSSAWFITANTNQTHDDYVQKLNDAMTKTYQNIKQFMIFKDGKTWNEAIKAPPEVDFTIEIAPRTKTIHSHGILKFPNHNSILHLDYVAMRKYIENELQVKGRIHLHVKIIKGEKTLEYYIHKNTTNKGKKENVE